ncbi:hypothetical protein [Rhizobium rhizogenes]|uniref:hypothetical protein n=1 Tax=Rhizobium rhizogenes TaxID=359 RepID=UPI0035AB9B15
MSQTRYAKAGKRFLDKTVAGLKDRGKSQSINTDKASNYGIAIADLKTNRRCPQETAHQTLRGSSA